MIPKQIKKTLPKIAICATCGKHISLTTNGRVMPHTVINGETKLCQNSTQIEYKPVRSL